MQAYSYIYYTQKDFLKYEAQRMYDLTHETKQEILSNALKRHQQRKRYILNNVNADQQAMIENLLTNSNDWIDNLNNENAASSAAAFSFPETTAEIASMIDNISKRTITQKQFISQLGHLLDVVFDEYLHNNKLLKDYTDYVTSSFIHNKNVGISKGLGKQQENVAGRIIDSVIGAYQGKIFSVKEYMKNTNAIQDKLTSSLLQLVALKAALGKSSQYGGGTSFIASSGQSQTYWDSIYEQTRKLLIDFKAIVGEIGAMEALKQGKQKELKLFEDLQKDIELKSTHRLLSGKGGVNNFLNCEMRAHFDPQLEKDIRSATNALKGLDGIWNTTKRTQHSPKADIVIQSGNNRIDGMIGISVKDYHEFSVKTGLQEKINIHLQSNTPLFTLLLRECQYKTQDIYTIMNIGAALPISKKDLVRPDFTRDKVFDTAWNKIMENVSYRAFYAALAGLGGKYDNVFYLDINNQIFSVDELIMNVMNNDKAAVKVAEDTRRKAFGLTRKPYQIANISHFIDGEKNSDKGRIRSRGVVQDSLSIMYRTKVGVSANFAQLVLLNR